MVTVTRTASGEGEAGCARSELADARKARARKGSKSRANMAQFTRGKKGSNEH
jgi:hypothetical protein